MSIEYPLEAVRIAVELMVAEAWPEVTAPLLYETEAGRLVLDRQVTPRVAVVWGGLSKETEWAPSVRAFGLSVDLYYFERAERPASGEARMRGKAADLLNKALAAGNRWSGVSGMHAWRVRDAEPPEAARAWRATGWEFAHIPLEVMFDYER